MRGWPDDNWRDIMGAQQPFSFGGNEKKKTNVKETTSTRIATPVGYRQWHRTNNHSENGQNALTDEHTFVPEDCTLLLFFFFFFVLHFLIFRSLFGLLFCSFRVSIWFCRKTAGTQKKISIHGHTAEAEWKKEKSATRKEKEFHHNYVVCSDASCKTHKTSKQVQVPVEPRPGPGYHGIVNW